MSVRLSELQRQVLGELAHMRVAHEDAWLTTERLKQLTNNPYALQSLYGLHHRLLVGVRYVDPQGGCKWRITDKGREAL